MHSDPTRRRIFGLVNSSLLEGAKDPVVWGLFTPVFGSAADPWTTGHDDAGNVNTSKRLPPLHDSQFIPVPAGVTEPAKGEPYVLGLIAGDEDSDGITVGPWDQIADVIAGPEYGKIREGVFAHPLEGFFLCKFASLDVPKYVAHGAETFDLSTAWSKIQQLSLLRVALWKNHPEWASAGVAWDPPAPRITLELGAD